MTNGVVQTSAPPRQLGLVGAITTWNMHLGPHWYPFALVVLAMPTAWLGGKLRVMQL